MSDETFIKRLNSVDVKWDDLKLVVTEIAELHEEEEIDADAALFVIIKMFSGDPDKATAIHFRLSALARAIKEQQTPGWTLPTCQDGCTLTRESLIHAAAICPFVEVNDKAGFDLNTLLTKALELAEPEGRA